MNFRAVCGIVANPVANIEEFQLLLMCSGNPGLESQQQLETRCSESMSPLNCMYVVCCSTENSYILLIYVIFTFILNIFPLSLSSRTGTSSLLIPCTYCKKSNAGFLAEDISIEMKNLQEEYLKSNWMQWNIIRRQLIIIRSDLLP